MTDALPPDDFRWQAFFQRSADAVFVLSRHRRLLFANRAWEACTGLALADVRGRTCRRTGRGSEQDRESAVLSALAPTREAMQGHGSSVRRRAHWKGAGLGWWHVSFFPIGGEGGPLGLLGRIKPLDVPDAPGLAVPERLMALRDRAAAAFQLDHLAGESPGVALVAQQARLAVQGRFPALLVGEAGSGKHWLARAIHNAGPARQAHFARLDCPRLLPAAVADVVLGPNARRLGLGTVYLWEPAALPRELQERLAERLTSDDADGPRVLAGTRTDPREQVKSGRLLDVLHCALGTLTIHVPPLRERTADVPELAEALLRRAAEVHGRGPRAIGAEALAVLRAHAWPGNLRELYDVLLSACARAKGERVEVGDLPFFLRSGTRLLEPKLPLDALLEQAERRLILLALRLAHDNRTRAAELLEVWRARLTRRMEHFGMTATGTEGEEGSR